MTRDELEFSISQYVDGTLAVGEVAALEERLATDADARLLLEEHRALNVMLKADRVPEPEIGWDALAERISQSVATREAPQAPARSYRLFRWPVSGGWLAAAAGVVLATALGIRMFQRDGDTTGSPSEPSVMVVRKVDAQPGPRPEKGPGVLSIAIGPAPSQNEDDASAPWRYADDVVSRPSRVVIASGAPSATDAGSQPY